MEAMSIGTAALAAIGGLRQQRTQRRRPARSGAQHRTGAAVLRDSIEEGTFEDVFFSPPAKGETDQILRAARKAVDAGNRLRREERAGTRTLTAIERAIVALTANTVRVLEELLTLARLNSGQVFPTYDYLAEATALGRATIARSIKALEEVGFLAKQRRFKRIEVEGIGPRYKQTSNAYRAMLPARVLAYLPRWMRPAPIPVDQEQRAADDATETRAMLSTLSCREFALAMVGGPLGKMLAKLGAGIDQQDSEYHDHTQPLTDSYNQARYGVGLDGQHVAA
jgi:predicted transcriptional regulator